MNNFISETVLIAAQIVFYVFLAIGTYGQFKDRIKDGRFSMGYRNAPLTISKILKYIVYAIILTIPIALAFNLYKYFNE
jgi:hypothetical protein